jgi:PadR family transcriptional regulator PadR
MSSGNPIRLSPTEHTVLSLLCDLGEAYGLRLVEQSAGELRRSSIYVLLSRLESRGFVSSRYLDTPMGEQGPRRRVYKVTGLGELSLRAWEAAQMAWRGVMTT